MKLRRAWRRGQPRWVVLGIVSGVFLSQAAPGQVGSPPYVFTTFAGVTLTGNADGAARKARFTYPNSVAVDRAGVIYVADTGNHAIRRITPEGEVSTLAGLPGWLGKHTGAGILARFSSPSGLGVDLGGNVYVADFGNDWIRRVSPMGEVAIAGFPIASPVLGSAWSPRGVAVDRWGNVYFSAQTNHTIFKMNYLGETNLIAGSTNAPGAIDGPGREARFNSPWGVAVDRADNVYVADHHNHTIRKITPDRVVTTLAGLAGQPGSADGTGGAARFWFPSGLAVDDQTNIYVADAFNSIIRKITADGTVSTFAGAAGQPGMVNGPRQEARFNQPRGLAIDRPGNLYVADTENHAIRQVAPNGMVTVVAGAALQSTEQTNPENPATFDQPAGVAVDAANNIYVADSQHHAVRRISPAGSITTVAGLPGVHGDADGPAGDARFFGLRGIALDGSGNLYVADSANHLVRKVSADGTVTTLAGLALNPGSADGQGSAARFDFPTALALDAATNIYVADTRNHTIRKVSLNGMVTTLAGEPGVFGSADGQGTVARFGFPQGIAVNKQGLIYVADSSNHLIRAVTSAGQVFRVAGVAQRRGSSDGGLNSVRFNIPIGIALDDAGTLYVADSWNHTVRHVFTNGVVTTLAGSAQVAGGTDGVGLAARFHFPAGIAVDSAGRVYVADMFNQSIRKGDPFSVSTSGNDAFTNRAGLAGLAAFATASNLNATREPGEPKHGGGLGSASLWWTWTAPTNGFVRIDTEGSTFSTLLGVYTGESLPALVQVAGDINSLINQITLVTFFAYAGTTYQIAVDGSLTSVGRLALRLQQTPQPQPRFILQPVARSVQIGEHPVFDVAAIGAPPLQYQWRWNDEPIPGATNSTYTLPGAQTASAGEYSVLVFNAHGQVASKGAMLAINQPLTGLFTATETWAASLTYDHWGTRAYTGVQKFGGTLTNSVAITNGSFLLVDHIQATADPSEYFPAKRSLDFDGGRYRINGHQVMPYVTGVPNFHGVIFLGAFKISVPLARGGAPPLFSDYLPYVATGTNLDRIDGAGQMLSTNLRVEVVSTLRLTPVTNEPTVVAFSPNQIMRAGKTVAFAVTGIGAQPMSFQWHHNGLMLAGKSAGRLRLTSVQPADQGAYYVVLSNAYGMCTSATMTLSVTAAFAGAQGEPDPFAAAAGSYWGLFSDPATPDVQSAGLVNITVRPGGEFTGQLRQGKRRWRCRGQFDPDGRANLQVTHPTLEPLELELRLDPQSGERLEGELRDPRWRARVLAYSTKFEPQTDAAISFPGRYTILLSSQALNPAGLSGDGFAAVSVGPWGAVTVAGHLADGTAFSQQSHLSRSGDCPVYISLHQGRGSLFGWIKLRPENDLESQGTLTWIRPGATSSSSLGAPSPLALEVRGSRYSAPVKAPANTAP